MSTFGSAWANVFCSVCDENFTCSKQALEKAAHNKKMEFELNAALDAGVITPYKHDQTGEIVCWWPAINKSKEDRYYLKILDVCCALHCSCTGAIDPLSFIEESFLMNWLDRRIDNWTPSIPRSITFDKAVHDLCEATLHECHWKRSRTFERQCKAMAASKRVFVTQQRRKE